MLLDTLQRCLTPRELAARWRCRVTTVRAMIRGGELPAIQIAGHVRVVPEAIATAEAGSLAVKPARRRKRETVPREIQEMLAD